MRINSALFFDGQSSKPHDANLKIDKHNYRLCILLVDDDSINYWDLDDMEILSLNSGSWIQCINLRQENQAIQFNRLEYPDLYNHLLQRTSRIANSYQIINSIPFNILVPSGIILLLTIAFVYLRILAPWIGERAAVLIPKSMEVQLGNVTSNNLLAFYNIDSSKSAILQSFFEETGFESDYNIELFYLDNQITNAFAVPGGRIAVFDGLIQKMDCYEELVGLLAHELVHVNNRHSLKSMTKAASSYLIISVLSGDVSGVYAVILENTQSLNELAYSRSFEKEADLVGIGYMREHKHDPKGMVQLFESFISEGSILDSVSVFKNINDLEFLSTHPSTKNRIDYLRSTVDDQGYGNIINNEKLDSLFYLLKN